MWVVLCSESCVPPTDHVDSNVNLGFNDPDVRKLLELQDKSSIDSLYPFFHHKNPGVRFVAVRAFASIRNEDSLDSLLAMLKDPVLEVRSMAAYALGQIGSARAETPLIAAFTTEDTLSVNNTFNRHVLEALGRCGGKTTLKNIATVVSYRDSDDELLMGQVRAFYHFGQRGIFDAAASGRALQLLSDNAIDEKIRLQAAHYFGRFKEAAETEYTDRLINQLSIEDNPEIRMPLAAAVSRLSAPGLDVKLVQLLNTEPDYRVKCNVLKGFQQVVFDSIKPTIYGLIKDPNLHVATSAAELIGRKAVKEDYYEVKLLITPELDWRVKTALYHSMMKILPVFYTKIKNDLVAEVKFYISQSTNPYERAEWLRVLGDDPYQYLTLAAMNDKTTHPVEKTALVEAMGRILQHPEFIRAYGSKFVGVRSYIVNFLVAACKSGDSGSIAAASAMLKEAKTGAKGFVRDTTWFDATKAKLKLPQDLEAYNELLQARAYLFDSVYTAYKAPYSHSVDFDLLQNYGDSVQVVMKTTKGNITLVLFTEKAPGSVANFLQLINKDYYDNKYFHRVVPNFVVQAGCPRGDGYGSMDYTIRSELNLNYYLEAGLLGMAHAGNHTESSQFFITHSPAPHLDGNYTIFGKVKEGMDILHTLYQGDKIIDVIILKNS